MIWLNKKHCFRFLFLVANILPLSGQASGLPCDEIFQPSAHEPIDLDHLSTIRRPEREFDPDATRTADNIVEARKLLPQLYEEFKIRRDNFIHIKGKDLPLTEANFERVENNGKRSEVYKTKIGEKEFYYRPWEQSNADVARYNLAAAEVAKALELPHLAPEAKLIKTIRNGVEEFGVLSELTPGEKGYKVLSEEGYLPKRESYEEAQLFTHLIGNLDPHGNNFNVSADGKFHFFDFDLTFGANFDDKKRDLGLWPKPKYANISSEFIHNLVLTPDSLSPEMLERLKNIRRANLDALSHSELKQLHQRLDALLAKPMRETQLFSSAMPRMKLKVPDMDMMRFGEGKRKDVYGQVSSPVEMLKTFKEALKNDDIDLSRAPRIRDNLEILDWGAQMNLLDVGLVYQNPHASAAKNKVRIFLNDSSNMSTWIHELDHAAVALQRIKEYLSREGVPPNPLAVTQHFFRHDISEALKLRENETLHGDVKMQERLAKRSERQAGKKMDSHDLIYPLTEGVRRDMMDLESPKFTSAQKDTIKNRVVLGFRDLFEKQARLKSFLLRKGPMEESYYKGLFFDEPSGLEISKQWLKDFLAKSGSQNRVGVDDLDALQPLVEKAWQEYKIPRLMLEQ